MLSAKIFSLLCCLLGAGLGASRCLWASGDYEQSLSASDSDSIGAEDDDYGRQEMAAAVLLDLAKDPLWAGGKCEWGAEGGSKWACEANSEQSLEYDSEGGRENDNDSDSEGSLESVGKSVESHECWLCTTVSTTNSFYSNSEDDLDSDGNDGASGTAVALVNDSWELAPAKSKMASTRRAPANYTAKETPFRIRRFPRFSTIAELAEGWEACEEIKDILVAEYGALRCITGPQATELNQGYYKYAPIGKQIATLGKKAFLRKWKGKTLEEALNGARVENPRYKKLGRMCGGAVADPTRIHEIIRFPEIARAEDFPSQWPKFVSIYQSIPRPILSQEQKDEIRNRYGRLKPLSVMLDRLGHDEFLRTYKGMTPRIAADTARVNLKADGHKYKGAWSKQRTVG